MKNAFKTLKNDLPAGLVVFLVALPLCLGIAQASNANPFAGIIAGVIGGIVVTSFSASKYGVSGPAAGLTTIVLAAIGNMGYEAFLLSIVIAGVFQFLMGQFKLGFVGYFIPHSVIKGMLASIGIILILKQFPHAMGVDTDHTGDFSFKEADSDSNTFQQLYFAVKYFTPGALIISSISVAIMVLWDSTKLQSIKFFKLLPSSLIVVVIGIVINLVYKASFPQFALESFHLVHLPYVLVEAINGLMVGDFKTVSSSYSNLFTFPDFSAITNKDVYITAFTIAAVGSIETLLSVEATDNIDPEKNLTPTNKELKAQGIGNFISGLIGGIPITQVIVRSSANINAGAKSKMSALYHGVFLIIAVMLFPKVINLIPMASLAAILLVLGYKLANVKIGIQLWKTGHAQFVPFIITVVAIILTDLLIGIGIGLAVSMVTILRSNYEAAYTVNEGNGRFIVSFAFVVSFLNKGPLMLDLYKIPNDTKLVISAKKCHFISYDILELIKSFSSVVAKQRNIEVEFIGFERYGIHNEETEEQKTDKIKYPKSS